MTVVKADEAHHQADERAATDKGRTLSGSAATRLVQLAEAGDLDLFHTEEQEGYATVCVGAHRETWRLRSKGFQLWLRRAFYAAEKRTPGAQALQDAVGVLESKALFDGPARKVWTRIAEHDGRIYLDLVSESWEAIEISSDGWCLIDDPPVKFRRSRGMLPLPTPTRGGSLNTLRAFLNLANEEQWRLILAWLVAAFRVERPYTLLDLTGEQGSAKSTAARVLRELIDPNRAPLRSEPRETRDLLIAASNAHLVVLDNLSHLPPGLSDDLCRLATGGGFAARTLYTDDEETLFHAIRPVIVTGIEELSVRPDLLDRTLLLLLPPVAEDRRRPEAAFWTEFQRVRPAVLGALLDVVTGTLRHLPDVRVDRLPRMADFALVGVAVERTMGWPDGSFLAAYRGNRAVADTLALDGPVAAALLAFTDQAPLPWVGTAGELLTRMSPFADDATRRSRAWPVHPRGLAGLLRRLASNLRRAGIELEFGRESGTGSRRLITIDRIDPAEESPNDQEAVGAPQSQPSPPTQGEAKSAEFVNLPSGGRGDGPDSAATVDGQAGGQEAPGGRAPTLHDTDVRAHGDRRDGRGPTSFSTTPSAGQPITVNGDPDEWAWEEEIR